MRKVLLSIVLIALLVVVLLSGCGGSKNSKTTDEAQRILEDSRAKMVEVESLTTSGEVVIETPEAEVKRSAYNFEIKLKTGEAGEAEMRMTAEGDGERLETIVAGGWAYAYDSDTGWEKYPVDRLDEVNQPFTHEDLLEMSEYAENLRMLPDEGGNYVIAFDVSPEFFDRYAGGVSGEEGEDEVSGLLQDMLRSVKISAIYKVDKESMLATEALLEIELPSIPTMGEVDSVTEMVFSGYNEPVTIEVPPEAQAAPEKELKDLPGLPGLGF